MINPILHGNTAEKISVYKVEPYVVAADVYAVAPHIGRGGWTWYTGSAGWLCPSQSDEFRRHENTYAFSLKYKSSEAEPPNQTRDAEGRRQSDSWAWDNTDVRPGLSGFRGPFSSTAYIIPQSKRVYPHGTMGGRGQMRLYIDNSVSYFEIGRSDNLQ